MKILIFRDAFVVRGDVRRFCIRQAAIHTGCTDRLSRRINRI